MAGWKSLVGKTAAVHAILKIKLDIARIKGKNQAVATICPFQKTYRKYFFELSYLVIVISNRLHFARSYIECLVEDAI